MKPLKNLIQEGILNTNNIDTMDDDVLIVELTSDLLGNNKSKFDKACFKLYDLLSKTGERVKSNLKLETDEYYIKFPPGLSDRYGHALVVFKHCKTDHSIVSTTSETSDYIFYRANGTSAWKFDWNISNVKYSFRDNLIYKCPDNLKPVVQDIMNKIDPFRGQLKF